jgi:BirA family biotin operon repressor/biotin-[acetyl-CoA-carboxylase] ligase
LIETVAEIPSTNSALMARLGEGGPGEGFWLIADRQTAGRGRAGRVWNDGFGNFMGSTVAHVTAGDPPPQTLALVAGIAAYGAVSAFAPGLAGLMLKWPNDVLVGDAKIAGILLERQQDSVVVGIGVNLAEAPELTDRTAISLAALGYEVDRDAFAARLAQEWALALHRWHGGEWGLLRQEWLARAHRPGTLLSVNDPEHGRVVGSFAGIDENGVALLRLADGATRAIHAGDLDLVGG